MDGTIPRFILLFIFLLSGPLSYAAGPTENIKIKDPENLRYLKDGILEFAVQLKTGDVIQVPTEAVPQNYFYRDSNGKVKFSSNFFYGGIRILSAQKLTAAQIQELNNIEGALYVSSLVIEDKTTGQIKPLPVGKIGDDYLEFYESSGRPRFSFSEGLKKRFGAQLNRAIQVSEIESQFFNRSIKVFAELQRMANRKLATPSSVLFVDSGLAKLWSIDFENKGLVPEEGAWSVAVKGTATRHGFADRPCAEFQSEILRQAFKVAGFDHRQDFNEESKNMLIWSQTAAVVNLSRALFRAGWIPWEAKYFKPMLGSIAMHELGTTPGHTYIVGGDDGQIIVDNGSPRGRDLRQTSHRILSIMYKTGLFFLPPGLIPEAW